MSAQTEKKTTVVKVGGARLTSASDFEQLSRHVLDIRERGERVVVVHGGGDEIGDLHDALGLPTHKKAGIRVTPVESMAITTMVLCGLVNKRLVTRLLSFGVPAMGLSGVDLAMLRSGLINERSLGRVGGPPTVDRTALERLLGLGVVPVLAPVSLGPDDWPVNVNADTAAQSVASALQADALEFVCDVPGVRTDDGVARQIAGSEVQPLIEKSIVSGGMVPKLQAALAAVGAGVDRVRVGSLASIIEGNATEVHS
jgi:acetylglutamate kinase